MPRDDAQTDLDFRFLDTATASLLGYFVHTWFRKYLGVVSESYRRLLELGLIEGLTEPTAAGRYSMLFDFMALDMEKTSFINGIYFYLLAAHKGANHRLMNRYDGKQVLYLRGYDFEGSVATGGGMAMGFSSLDTMRFNLKLGDLLAPHCQLFKVMSPKDVYWETVAAQRHFHGDFADMIPMARYQMRSVFLNALEWKQGVTTLLDRMDHYIVYVSSITESVLWELTQLNTDARRTRVTLVFDDAAIENKAMQLSLRDRMQAEYGEHLIWAKEGGAPAKTVEELRADLGARFVLTTPEAFEKDIETHRQRIAQSGATLAPGARETWIDFRFHPALDVERLLVLREFSARIDGHIRDWTGARGIDCLPLFLNFVQLRIFLTLLLGEHHETGLALAAYAAVMEEAHGYYAAPDTVVGALSAEGRERHLAMLTEHLEMARHIGWCMLSFGKSHEFGDFRAVARADFDEAFGSTKAAVAAFFASAVARHQR